MGLRRRARAGPRTGGHQPLGIRLRQASKGEQAENTDREGNGVTIPSGGYGQHHCSGTAKRHAQKPLIRGLPFRGFTSPPPTAAGSR